jgi:hypothetical protein
MSRLAAAAADELDDNNTTVAIHNRTNYDVTANTANLKSSGSTLWQ